MLAPEITRECSSCGTVKDINAFGTYSPKVKGPRYFLHRKRCKQCITEDQLEKRHEGRRSDRQELTSVPPSQPSKPVVLIKGASNVAF